MNKWRWLYIMCCVLAMIALLGITYKTTQETNEVEQENQFFDDLPMVSTYFPGVDDSWGFMDIEGDWYEEASARPWH